MYTKQTRNAICPVVPEALEINSPRSPYFIDMYCLHRSNRKYGFKGITAALATTLLLPSNSSNFCLPSAGDEVTADWTR
jgi:hypothetical protein